jgi:hypothetical protein
MKKLAIAALVIAAGAGGYWLSEKNDSSVTSDPMLAYVPADTLAFSGQFTPFPIKDYFYSIAGTQQYPQIEEMKSLLSAGTPQERFFLGFYSAYLDRAQDPERLIKDLGLGDNLKSFFYTLGALPVLKFDIADAKAFWAYFDAIEKESGLVHRNEKIADSAYRAYTLTDDTEEKIDLIIAEKAGWVTVTFNSSFNDSALLEMALGIKAVENPMSSTTMIQDMIAQHGFMNDGIAFINHVELVKGLTSTDGNLFAKQLTQLFKREGEDPREAFNSATCQTELMAVANNWPRTVAGYNSYSVSNTHSDMDVSLVVETRNQTILAGLKAMRGFIPTLAHELNDNIFTAAVGIDVDNLAPSLSKVWNELQTPSFECEPLAQLQAQLSEQNPAMLGMMTGMVQGVKGVSIAVQSYSLSNESGEPSLASLDAMVSLSADKPLVLANMAKGFVPSLANMDLVDGGEALDVTQLLMLPPQMAINTFLAIKGKHLVLYTGKGEQLATEIAKEPLSNNGLFTLSADYGQLLSPLVKVIEESGEEMPEELEMLKDYNMKVQMDFDINDKGIVLRSVVNSKAH